MGGALPAHRLRGPELSGHSESKAPTPTCLSGEEVCNYTKAEVNYTEAMRPKVLASEALSLLANKVFASICPKRVIRKTQVTSAG